MTERRTRQVATAIVAVLCVGLTAIGIRFHSVPWLVVGGWLGVALTIEWTWRKP